MGIFPTKEDDILHLGCENVNSLSLYNPRGSKMRKLINIHNKYQTNGACIVEHGINLSACRLMEIAQVTFSPE